MFCKKCGSPLDEGAKFCGNCGTPVDAQGTQNTQSPRKPDGYTTGVHRTYEQSPKDQGDSLSEQRPDKYGRQDSGKKKKDFWEEESYDEEYERQAKREKRIFIILSVVIVILVAAIIVGVVLLVRGEQENRQAPQLNEQLREGLEKDDQEAEDTTEDPEEEVTPEITQEPDTETDSNRQVTPNPTEAAQNTPTPTATPTPTPTATPTPTPEVVEEVSGDFILPQSSVQYITNADLAGLSEWEIRVARNEIYARHGRIFTSPDLAEYFSQKSWYVPSIPADQFDNSYLNSIEIANLQVITQYEADHNLNQ